MLPPLSGIPVQAEFGAEQIMASTNPRPSIDDYMLVNRVGGRNKFAFGGRQFWRITDQSRSKGDDATFAGVHVRGFRLGRFDAFMAQFLS